MKKRTKKLLDGCRGLSGQNRDSPPKSLLLLFFRKEGLASLPPLKSFSAQMRALAACHMSLGYGQDTLSAEPIERFSTWLSQSEDGPGLMPGIIELTPEFFESLTQLPSLLIQGLSVRSSTQRWRWTFMHGWHIDCIA